MSMARGWNSVIIRILSSKAVCGKPGAGTDLGTGHFWTYFWSKGFQTGHGLKPTCCPHLCVSWARTPHCLS